MAWTCWSRGCARFGGQSRRVPCSGFLLLSNRRPQPLVASHSARLPEVSPVLQESRQGSTGQQFSSLGVLSHPWDSLGGRWGQSHLCSGPSLARGLQHGRLQRGTFLHWDSGSQREYPQGTHGPA